MSWPAFPVFVPLLVAVLLAVLGKRVPRAIRDAATIATAAAVAVVGVHLAAASRAAPIVYWFGGWAPRDGIAMGVAFVVDPIGAGLVVLTATLTVAALVFSLRYFDDVGALFHVLVLIFLAALAGFGLTGDLFNLFVFFELMSAAGIALCGYKSDDVDALQGALNFGVTNTVGGFLVLMGIALLYGRTGALDAAQIARSLGVHTDGLVLTALALVTSGFFVKAAVVPFHFWIADAHAVAPTPVSVLFSGVMVEAGVYAVMRVHGSVFATALEPHAAGARGIFLGAGALTAIAGGLMCFAQHHLKRLLAFSTVSHVGLLVCGLGLSSAAGLGGAAVYVLGHGLVKGALFLCAGIVLHRLRSVDERALRGRGRPLRATGFLFALGALGLAGVPPFATFTGTAMMEHAAEDRGHGWLSWVFAATGILTAGAVLRATGRIFLGMGPPSDDHLRERQEKPETRSSGHRVPASMIGAVVGLLAVAIVLGLAPGLRAGAALHAMRTQDTAAYAARVLDSAAPPALDPAPCGELGGPALRSALVLAGAALLAWVGLHRPAQKGAPPWQWLRDLQSGHVGDYVAWLTVGVACLGGLCAWLLG